MTDETKQEEKEIIIGDFTPKRKFLNFISAVNGARIRFIRDVAFIKGEKLSGILDGVVFKITICDEGTIKFEEQVEDGKDPVSNEAQIQRLIEDIDSMDVTGYAQKFVIGELEFADVNGDRCYLEVEHEKPINKLAALVDMFNEEERTKEETTISDKGMSLLDSLFGDTSDDVEVEENTEVEETTEEETIVEEKPALSYMEEQFKKMNEGKIVELQDRIDKKEDDIKKYTRDISFAESKLKETKEELGVLETRLESMYPGEDPNGFVFYVSEEQKNETGVDESTKHIVDKIADLMKLKKDVLYNYLTEGYYTIKIAPKDDFENTEYQFDREILSKVVSIEPLAKVSMIGNGEFEYRGELNWHQIVGKMIRNGFEQLPEYDEFCNSNSYESHEEPVATVTDSTQDMKDAITNMAKGLGMKDVKFEEDGITLVPEDSETSTDFKAKTLKIVNEPTHLIVMGTLDHNENSDFQLTDDYSSFDAYINGKKFQKRYGYESDGFVSIMTVDQYKKWLSNNPWATEDGGGCDSFFLPNFSGTIEIGAKLEDGSYTTDFDESDYILHQFENDYPDVFLNFPSGTTIIDMKNHEIPLAVIRDMNIDKILNEKSSTSMDGKIVKIRTSWEGTGDSPCTYIVKMDYSKLSQNSIGVLENMTLLSDGITIYNKTNEYNLCSEIESLYQMPKDSDFDMEIEIEFES